MLGFPQIKHKVPRATQYEVDLKRFGIESIKSYLASKSLRRYLLWLGAAAVGTGSIYLMTWILYPEHPDLARCEQSTLTVNGTSMSPLLTPGQTVLVEWRGRTGCGPFAPGQIVAYRLSTESSLQLKRVIARSGDLITLAPSGELLRDGYPPINSRGHAYRLTKPQWDMVTLSLDENSKVLPNQNILLGESVSMALDSRLFGSIHDDDIIGVLSEEYQPPKQEMQKLSEF